MQTNKWSVAALDGLLLALITIIATLIQTVLKPGVAINWLLWLVKFSGSIGLLYYFMKDYSNNRPSLTYKEGFNFGFILCFLSSVICACYLFLHYAIIFPDSIAATMEQAAVALESSNPEAMDVLSKLENSFPQIMFISSLIYYTLFGILASAIIANYTKKGDVFTE